jgi:hypothetical protein
MKKAHVVLIIILIGILAVVITVGISVARKRGIPFIAQKEQWTIGIYRGNTPFSFDSPLNILNPILKAEHVTDVPAKFVADPFLIKDEKTWYLFFEVYNNNTQQGDLAVATSKNTWFWNYEQIIIDEPFHLSYPYVFMWESDYYLIPESYEDNSIRLYRADEFPTRWSFMTKLVEGRDFVDNSIVHYSGYWWLFASITNNDTLYLYYAEKLTGPWTEHPASPIVAGDVRKARPSGRLLEYENKLYRYTMDLDPEFGTHQVMVYEITELSPSSYAEVLAQNEPVLKAGGSGWKSVAMHQIDPIQVRPGYWIASVDGFGTYTIFGFKY